jgi:hypothetical protein
MGKEKKFVLRIDNNALFAALRHIAEKEGHSINYEILQAIETHCQAYKRDQKAKLFSDLPAQGANKAVEQN